MLNYDLNVILKPSLNEVQINAEKDTISAQVERYEGSISKLDEWGKTRLAYPINKQLDGHYLIYSIQLNDNEAPKAIEHALRLRDNVMRALIIRDRPEWSTLKKAEKSPEVAA